MRHFTIRAPFVVALVTVLVASAAPGLALAPSLVSVNPSPYATPGCIALDATQPGSLNYRNSETEPQAAVDPTNTSHLVGVFHQDRWSNGGAHGLVSAFSTNGGSSWTSSPLPFSVCYHLSGFAGPFLNFQRASDGWVSIGPGTPSSPKSGSTVYAVSLSFDQTPFEADVNASHNAVGAAVSYDGGATWTHVQMIIEDPCITISTPALACNTGGAPFNDKESVTADPNHPGVAYAVWDRLVVPPASGEGLEREKAFFGPAFFSKTTDFGAHWSTPKQIVTLPSQDQTIGNVIVVNHQNGTLYDFFDLINGKSSNNGKQGCPAAGTRACNVAFVKSTDGGATWSEPTIVAAEETVGVHDPNNLNPRTNTPPAPSRTADIIPEPAINPANGQLYVVWQDARFNGFTNDETLISTSNDGGVSWSPPELVNTHTGEPAYDPSVFVDATGKVGVTYFQWASNVSGNEAASLFIRHSTAPGSSTAAPTFDAARLLDGPFNNLAAPVARGYFLGDYQGLVANASGFIPFYVKTNCSDGSATVQPSCRAIASVLSPTSRTPTDKNSTDVYALPGS